MRPDCGRTIGRAAPAAGEEANCAKPEGAAAKNRPRQTATSCAVRQPFMEEPRMKPAAWPSQVILFDHYPNPAQILNSGVGGLGIALPLRGGVKHREVCP